MKQITFALIFGIWCAMFFVNAYLSDIRNDLDVLVKIEEARK